MVDADVASSKEYTEFESKHNRHLNMMAESVRNPLNDKHVRIGIFVDKLLLSLIKLPRTKSLRQ